MPPGLFAAALTTVAVFLAVFLAPRAYRQDAYRIGAVWILGAVLAFIVPMKYVVFGVLLVGLALLSPKGAAGRVAFFIGVLPALPQYYSYLVPFPGLNFLTFLNFAMLASFVILTPAVFVRNNGRKGALVTPLVFVFVLIIAMTSIAVLPFTSVVRTFVDTIIVIVLPVVAVMRALRTEAELERALGAFYISALVLMFIVVLSTLRQWNYYFLLSDTAVGSPFVEKRYGFLRMYATLVHTLLGFLAGCAAVLAMRFAARRVTPKAMGLPIALAMGFVIFTTGSRGAFLGAAVALGLSWIFARSGGAMRTIVFAGLFVGAGFLSSSVIGGADIKDDYGTFAYRAELLRTSIEQIRDHPLFGAPNFIESERFQHLRQGQGIIDIVNTYLQVALAYGLVGLAVFLMTFFVALNAAMSTLAGQERALKIGEGSRRAKENLTFLIAALVAYLVLIGTVSAVSYITQYGQVLIGLTVAAARIYDLKGMPSGRERHEDLAGDLESVHATSVARF